MSSVKPQLDLFGLPISSERLRRAREMRGLTQVGLANAAGIDQSHVACLEAGTRCPSAQVLSSLARALELPDSYFTQPVRAYLSAGTLRYRAKADLGKRAATRIRFEAEHALEIVLALAERVNLIPIRLGAFGAVPAEAARNLRTEMGVPSDRPLHHLIRNFEKLGGIVIALGAQEGFDAFADWGGRLRELPVVAIADGSPPDRLRMNLAHEIGHLILHRDAMIPNRQAENQAFSFAGQLLAPSEPIIRDLMSSELNLEALVAVKRKWGISVSALVRRGRDLGLISERHYRTLNARINAVGWKYNEPSSAERFAERPLAVRKMAETAFGVPLPFAKMERALHIPQSQLRIFFSRYGSAAAEKSPTIEIPSVSRRVQ